jgi:hypothetical protein
MAKTKSKPAAAPAPAKKGVDGGRVTKSGSKVEQAKSAAKAAVGAVKATAKPAAEVAEKKIKGILKTSTVTYPCGIVLICRNPML